MILMIAPMGTALLQAHRLAAGEMRLVLDARYGRRCSTATAAETGRGRLSALSRAHSLKDHCSIFRPACAEHHARIRALSAMRCAICCMPPLEFAVQRAAFHRHGIIETADGTAVHRETTEYDALPRFRHFNAPPAPAGRQKPARLADSRVRDNPAFPASSHPIPRARGADQAASAGTVSCRLFQWRCRSASSIGESSGSLGNITVYSAAIFPSKLQLIDRPASILRVSADAEALRPPPSRTSLT